MNKKGSKMKKIVIISVVGEDSFKIGMDLKEAKEMIDDTDSVREFCEAHRLVSRFEKDDIEIAEVNYDHEEWGLILVDLEKFKLKLDIVDFL